MDLLDDGEAGNAHEYSVAELSGAVKRVIEGEFGRVRVRGEVGRVMRARSGHLYFDLKDDRAVLACTTWKGQIAGLGVIPEEGMEVVATGRMTTFGSQSKYQLNAEEVSVAGVGALMAMLEKRKTALAAEGLFDAERKRPLPYLPEIIGVVTSPTGAVIRDILHRLRERFPRKVLVWPVAVQGKGAAEQVARAIAGFNALSPGGALPRPDLPRPDLLIVARGGGSIEDLWGFNEEVVARAAAASGIPLISAVGHETDTTLIDYVSDRRAPTPTAAAELAVPVRRELILALEGFGGRMARALLAGLEARRQRLRDMARGLPRAEALVAEPRQRLDLAVERLRRGLLDRVASERQRLGEARGALRPGVLRARLSEEQGRAGDRAARLARALGRRAEQARAELAARSARFHVARLAAQLQAERARFTRLARQLAVTARRGQDVRADRLARVDRMRESLGYRETLARGYAVVRGDGDVITTRAAAGRAAALEIEFVDGRMAVGSGAKTPRRSAREGPEQGSLF